MKILTMTTEGKSASLCLVGWLLLLVAAVVGCSRSHAGKEGPNTAGGTRSHSSRAGTKDPPPPGPPIHPDPPRPVPVPSIRVGP